MYVVRDLLLWILIVVTVFFDYRSGRATVKPCHPWDVANWLLYKGGLIIQCTFNREVLFGTLLGGCFREVTFLYRSEIWLL